MGGCGAQLPVQLLYLCQAHVSARCLPLHYSALTNENKSQAKSALVGLLGYVWVKYKPDKMLFPGESQRHHLGKWKTALLLCYSPP